MFVAIKKSRKNGCSQRLFSHVLLLLSLATAAAVEAVKRDDQNNYYDKLQWNDESVLKQNPSTKSVEKERKT